MSEFIESSNLMFLELDKHLETLISAFKGGPNLGSSSNSGKMTPETVGFVLLFFTQKIWNVIGFGNIACQFVSLLSLPVQTS